MISAEHFRGAADVADAHGGGTGQAVKFSEAVDLHGTGKGHKGIGTYIQGLRKKTGNDQQERFYQKDHLPPVDFFVCPETVVYTFCDVNTQKECAEGNKIAKCCSPMSLSQVLPQQDNVSGLGIGKDPAAAIVGISILETAGQG